MSSVDARRRPVLARERECGSASRLTDCPQRFLRERVDTAKPSTDQTIEDEANEKMDGTVHYRDVGRRRGDSADGGRSGGLQS